MRAVLLQPTYLPWMGYFGMIDSADTFVFYDDTQFVKQSWQQRNRIRTSSGSTWLVVPVTQSFGQAINEVKICNEVNWRPKHWKSIKYNYTKSPFFEDYASIFEGIYKKEWENLVDLNITLIKEITKLLGFHSEFKLSSDLNVSGTKTERVINVLKEIGANEYISGPAAESYIELERFKKEGITLYWYEFDHPSYPQSFDGFTPQLSVLDLLFNVGNESPNVIKEGGKNALKKAH